MDEGGCGRLRRPICEGTVQFEHSDEVGLGGLLLNIEKSMEPGTEKNAFNN